jgi:hypothetical protein
MPSRFRPEIEVLLDAELERHRKVVSQLLERAQAREEGEKDGQRETD